MREMNGILEEAKVRERVVAALKARNIEATYEYPGYVAIGDLSFGTANGTWGWDDCQGQVAKRGGESNIPADSTDVAAIVAYIVKVMEEQS